MGNVWDIVCIINNKGKIHIKKYEIKKKNNKKSKVEKKKQDYYNIFMSEI